MRGMSTELATDASVGVNSSVFPDFQTILQLIHKRTVKLRIQECHALRCTAGNCIIRLISIKVALIMLTRFRQ